MPRSRSLPAVAAGLALVLCAALGAATDTLPDKPVLSYLLDHTDLAAELADLGWSDDEVRTLEAVLAPVGFELGQLRRESDRRLRLGLAPDDEVADFNRRVREAMRSSRDDLRARLGELRWAELEVTAAALWQLERDESAARWDNVAGPYLAYTVFCTQYAAETAWEIAIPDAFVKFANRDWSYEPGYPDGYYGVRLTRDATVVEDVPVWDVGPWNIDDNYWNETGGNPRPRRLFTDLPQGKPEAEAAFYDGYNGGLDQFGRVVLNPAGCDLAPDVAAALGLAYLENDWVELEYKWEELPGGVELVFDNPAVDVLVGEWTTGTSAGDKYGPDYLWTSTGTVDPRFCVWRVDVTEPGTYEIAFWWSEGSNRNPEAEVGIKQGSPILSRVDQQTGGGRWNPVGTASLSAGEVLLGWRNGGPSGFVVICDAVKLTKLD